VDQTSAKTLVDQRYALLQLEAQLAAEKERTTKVPPVVRQRYRRQHTRLQKGYFTAEMQRSQRRLPYRVTIASRTRMLCCACMWLTLCALGVSAVRFCSEVDNYRLHQGLVAYYFHKN
jgi:Asp-tRNA(Asn)/Glu-tRNA(Gln) amidotransferase A subunit family amidase